MSQHVPCPGRRAETFFVFGEPLFHAFLSQVSRLPISHRKSRKFHRQEDGRKMGRPVLCCLSATPVDCYQDGSDSGADAPSHRYGFLAKQTVWHHFRPHLATTSVDRLPPIILGSGAQIVSFAGKLPTQNVETCLALTHLDTQKFRGRQKKKRVRGNTAFALRIAHWK
jgi:hypothetical protein